MKIFSNVNYHLNLDSLIVESFFRKTEFFTIHPPPLTPWEHIVYQLCDVYSNIIRRHEYYELKETVPPDISLIDHETKIDEENMAPPNSKKKKTREIQGKRLYKSAKNFSQKRLHSNNSVYNIIAFKLKAANNALKMINGCQHCA